MKLSSDDTHPLENALLPRTNHVAPLDYRITWLLHYRYMIARILRIHIYCIKLILNTNIDIEPVYIES